MSGELRQRVNVPRIPKRFYGPTKAQQAIIRAGLSSVQSAESVDPTTKLAMDAIARQAMKAEAATPARFGRAARIAASMRQTPFARVGGLAGRAARIAASTEGGVAMASAGLVYGMGGHLLEEYQHKKADKKLRTGGYQEISGEGVKVVHTDPSEAARYTEASLSSSGSHRVSHQHALPSEALSGSAPLELRETAAKPESLIPGKVFQIAEQDGEAELSDAIPNVSRLQSFPTQPPIHHFRISRTQPYSLVDWERGARAKAMLLGGA